MKRVFLCGILAVFLSGCVTTSSMIVEKGYIDTDPPGAVIILYDNYTGKKIDSMVSPADYFVRRGKYKELYLKVDKGGYQSENIPVPAEGTDMDIYVPLREGYGNRIKRARSAYPEGMLKASEHTLALCEKALLTSRFSAAKITKQASLSFDELKRTYPEQRSSVLIEALGTVIETLHRLDRLNSYYYHTKVEKTIRSETQDYIDDIKHGLYS